MADLSACASCASTQNLKHCARCKTVAYCSPTCQRAHWHDHKSACEFRVVVPAVSQATTPSDALTLLRTMPDPAIKQEQPNKSPVAHQALNIPELRLAIFSELPAIELLATQRVCRSWYLTSTLDQKLQQRLFFSPGPGKLVVPSLSGMCKARFTLSIGACPKFFQKANLAQRSIHTTPVSAML